MVRINQIIGVNNNYNHKTSFKGNDTTQTNPQIEQLQDVKPDFAVKTPQNYTKTGEINFPYDTKAYCYKLANGQRIVIVPQEGETVLKTYVNTGSMNEPDNLRGISHYIEHNLFNGSQGLEEGDFFKQVDKMGASTNASTGFAETNYFISSNLLNPNDLENKIKLHASMLETPLFTIEKLEKEKGVVNSEINMITSRPENIAINKMIKNLYGIKTTSTDMIGGTTENITNLTREDVVNYYQNNYYPANMVTVITGDVKPEDTIKLISKYFVSQKCPNKIQHHETLKPIQNTVREDIISDKATATNIVVGFDGPNTKNTQDRIYTEALLTLLSLSPSARINNKLKLINTSSLADIDKISTEPNNGKVLMFMAESSEENSEKVLKTIFNEIGNIENNPPTEKEMNIIKKILIRNFSNSLETSFSTNTIIGNAFIENNQEYLTNYEQIVNSMTAKDLINTAKKYLDVNKASVTLVHPAGTTEETIKQNHKNVSFTGTHKQAINPLDVREYNTQNNYRVITQNSKTNNVEVIYKIYVDGNINTKPSAAIVLKKLLNEGTLDKKQEDFDADLAENGIITGFSASENCITCAFGCDSQTVSKGFDSVLEVINNPRFADEDFKRIKNTIRERILTSEKSAFDKLNAELFKGLPEGQTKEDILKDLETLTVEDVKMLYNKIITNGKGIITIAAPFERKPELKNELFYNISKFNTVKEFNPKEKQKIFTPVNETKILTDIHNKNQAEIVQAYKFKTNGNIKDSITCKLLNTILGGNASSRLFMDLREKEKLAYHVRSTYSNKEDIGIFTLKIGTTTENKETGETSFKNVQKSIEGFNKHIEKIKTEKVSEEELANAKLNLKNTILNNNQTASYKIDSLLNNVNSPYGIFKDNLILKEIDKITVDDIYNAANYIFSGKPTYSIVATENTLNANAQYLNTLS